MFGREHGVFRLQRWVFACPPHTLCVRGEAQGCELVRARARARARMWIQHTKAHVARAHARTHPCTTQPCAFPRPALCRLSGVPLRLPRRDEPEVGSSSRGIAAGIRRALSGRRRLAPGGIGCGVYRRAREERIGPAKARAGPFHRRCAQPPPLNTPHPPAAAPLLAARQVVRRPTGAAPQLLGPEQVSGRCGRLGGGGHACAALGLPRCSPATLVPVSGPGTRLAGTRARTPAQDRTLWASAPPPSLGWQEGAGDGSAGGAVDKQPGPSRPRLALGTPPRQTPRAQTHTNWGLGSWPMPHPRGPSPLCTWARRSARHLWPARMGVN
jgi:hypothetical protein